MYNDLYSKLIDYSKSDMYPFHMPGHKRQKICDELPYDIDLTEIDGFDNLQHPTGILRKLESFAAAIFNIRYAFVLVNGATGGVLAAVRALSKQGDRVLIARNCHKSVYNAVELCGLQPEYIMPDQAFDGDIPLSFYGGINPEDVEKALTEHPDISLVIITNPTYEGICSDVKKISEICRSHGARLFVDEAHGAYHLTSAASRNYPRVYVPNEAVVSGADAAVLSLHKSYPSMTQTALLFTNDSELSRSLRTNLSVFQTSSPSYVLMASVGCCLRMMGETRSWLLYHCANLQKFYESTSELSLLKILFNGEQSVHDSRKILISSADTDLSGYELAKRLRNDYHIETEMAAPDYVLALTSIADTDEGYRRLIDALKKIDSNCVRCENANPLFFIKELPKRAFIPCKKYKYKSIEVPLESSEGKIAMETVMAYPPGSPCIVAGEVITEEIINYLSCLESLGAELIFDSYSHSSAGMINVADL